MKSKTILLGTIFIGLGLFILGCSPELRFNYPTQTALPPPQVFTTQLPGEILPTQLPLVITPLPTIPPAIPPRKDNPEFGVEIGKLDVNFSDIQAMGAKWVRYNGVYWSDIEPYEGEIAWDTMAPLEEALLKAHAAGLKMILIVRSTPYWAQKTTGYGCGQIKAEKFSAFGDFMVQLAIRYGAEPFNAHYWELWNEPDVDPVLVVGKSPFGCWGDRTDAFYGGGYYAEMLKTVVPRMRAADPNVKVLSGGILLDCDPTNPGQPGFCDVGNELPPRFMEGVLKAGGSAVIDMLSYHGYPSYNPNIYSPIISEFTMATWQARGGVVAGKSNYLHELMAAYNTHLPLFLTESSILCSEKLPQCNPVSPEFLQKQAEYGAWSVVRNYAEDINTIWYTFNGPGWRNSALLDENQNPRPVYFAIQAALRRVTGSSAVRRIDEYPGLIGYEFQTQQGKFYFLAPVAETPPLWVVPENAAQAVDIFGQVVSFESLSPLTAPVFIDLR